MCRQKNNMWVPATQPLCAVDSGKAPTAVRVVRSGHPIFKKSRCWLRTPGCIIQLLYGVTQRFVHLLQIYPRPQYTYIDDKIRSLGVSKQLYMFSNNNNNKLNNDFWEHRQWWLSWNQSQVASSARAPHPHSLLSWLDTASRINPSIGT